MSKASVSFHKTENLPIGKSLPSYNQQATRTMKAGFSRGGGSLSFSSRMIRILLLLSASNTLIVAIQGVDFNIDDPSKQRFLFVSRYLTFLFFAVLTYEYTDIDLSDLQTQSKPLLVTLLTT